MMKKKKDDVLWCKFTMEKQKGIRKGENSQLPPHVFCSFAIDQ